MRDLSLTLPHASKKKTSSLTLHQINMSILAAIAVLVIAYLFVLTSMGTKGYQIKKLEQSLRELENTQKQLLLKSSDLQSVQRIQENAKQLNFVPTTSVTYLKDFDFALK